MRTCQHCGKPSEVELRPLNAVKTSFDTVLQAACKESSLPVEMVLSVKRTAEVAFTRWLIMYLCRIDYGMRFEHIGRLMHRDHESAIYGVRSFQDLLSVEPDKTAPRLAEVKRIIATL